MNKICLSGIFLFLAIIFINAQEKVTVSGTVVDANGEPIIGATIVIKGTTIGTVTDVDGKYTLSNVPSNATLVFSSLGMIKQEVLVNNQKNINVTLLADITNLQEVVVVGYGQVRRATLTGAVSDLSSKEIQDIPVANLTSALEGRLAGVRVQQVSGRPGAGTSFQIRESSSNKAEESPLYVIDGVIRDKEAFDMLDPSEVESISVLKDASAAVYGVRSAGGVVVVQTKKGKEGKTKVNYSFSYGLSEPINVTKMLTAYEHAKMLNDAYDIQKISKVSSDRYSEDELIYFRDSIPGGGYDWLKNAWKNATVTRHSLNFNGGTDKIKYFIGGNTYYEDGNIENLWVKKYTIRSSIEAELFSWLNASIDVSIGNKQVYIPKSPFDSQDELLDGTFKALLQNPKWIPPVINGLPVKQGTMISNNPYAIWKNGFYDKDEANSTNLVARANIKVPFIKGLNVKLQVSQTKNNEYGIQYMGLAYGYSFMTKGANKHIIVIDTPDDSIKKEVLTSKPLYQESTELGVAYQYNTQINYNKTFGKHDLSAVLVMEVSESKSNRVGWAREGEQNVLNVDKEWAFNEKDKILSTNRDHRGDIGYVGRVNYSFADKYLAEFAFRYEASTKFPPENRWGFFPSLSTGWVVSEEEFFKNKINFINFFKVRASAGLTGNDATTSFSYLIRYKPDVSNQYLFGNTPVISVVPQNDAIANDQITWQLTQSYNSGIDLRFLKSKISLTVDAFYKYTTRTLDPIATLIPTTVGLSTSNKVAFNYGKVHAYGYEIELGYHDETSFKLEYGIKGNFSWAEARLLKVAQSPGAVGKWYDQLKNYKDNQPGAICSGMIRTEEEVMSILMDNPNYLISGEKPEPGMLNYLDIRGSDGSEGPNGMFSFDMIEDRTVIAKHTSPVYYYGATINLKYKFISFETTLSGKFGHKVFYDKEAMQLPTSTSNVPSFWADHWTSDNVYAAYPRAYNYGLVGNYSTFWMRDGHTLRVTDMKISLIAPFKWLNKFGLSQLRVFFNSKYWWTIINPLPYKDADLSKYNSYPMTRNYNLGININF